MMEGQAVQSPLVLTIGHSTRTLEEFIRLLHAHGVARVVDVRTVPRSRRNPQFNRETLPDSLKAAGVEYAHLASLGGLRHARPDSPNQGWRNESFRGFADYMQTEDFEKNIKILLRQVKKERVVLMCALVIRAGGRMFLQRMGRTLGARVKFGKGAARARRQWHGVTGRRAGSQRARGDSYGPAR